MIFNLYTPIIVKCLYLSNSNVITISIDFFQSRQMSSETIGEAFCVAV